MSKILSKYLEENYGIFPLKSNSKIPLPGQSWKDLVQYGDSLEPGEFTRLLGLYTDNNWAMATGQESEVTVLDVDVKHGGLESLRELEEELGKRLVPGVLTPTGGLHIYFEYTPELKQTVGFRPGLDIRNDGGYVVIPPSSIEGRSYELDDPQIRRYPVPEGLVEIVQDATSVPTTPVREGDGMVLEGGRNNFLASIAGFMRKQGTPVEAIAGALGALNDQALASPLPEWEIATIANSVARYEPDPEIEEDPPSTVVKASSLSTKVIEYLSDKELVKGEPTGLLSLDTLLGGGKRLGEVTCWHAEAKTGKNTLWHFLMHIWMKKGIPIGYASRELSPATEVIPNLLSLELGKDAWSADVQEERYQKLINEWPLFFTSGYGYLSLDDLKRWVENLKTNYGVNYIWIDHLHYCIKDPEDHYEASKFIKSVKTLSKQFDVHIDIIIQPNKLMDGQRLSKNTIKGGASMGQAIDNLFIMQREREVDNTVLIELTDSRSKMSRLGKFHLQYDQSSCKFVEVEVVREEPRRYGNFDPPAS